MKRLVFILAIIPFITSCLKYSEPKSLSLSGEYVIDKITYQETDGEPSPQDSTYLTGSVYNDNTEIPVLSSIIVGETKLHMDYSIIRLTHSKINLVVLIGKLSTTTLYKDNVLHMIWVILCLIVRVQDVFGRFLMTLMNH